MKFETHKRKVNGWRLQYLVRTYQTLNVRQKWRRGEEKAVLNRACSAVQILLLLAGRWRFETRGMIFHRRSIYTNDQLLAKTWDSKLSVTVSATVLNKSPCLWRYMTAVTDLHANLPSYTLNVTVILKYTALFSLNVYPVSSHAVYVQALITIFALIGCAKLTRKY